MLRSRDRAGYRYGLRGRQMAQFRSSVGSFDIGWQLMNLRQHEDGLKGRGRGLHRLESISVWCICEIIGVIHFLRAQVFVPSLLELLVGAIPCTKGIYSMAETAYMLTI